MFKMIERLRGNRKGFTLMELIIVMVVIGILVALAVPKFSQFRERAEIANIQNDLKVIESLVALELMELEVEPAYGDGVNNEIKEYYTKNGVVKANSADPTPKTALESLGTVEIPGTTIPNVIKNSGTSLEGEFFVNKDGNVFYVAP